MIRSYLRNYLDPHVLPFVIAQILFFSFMWISKSVHVIYFEQNNSITQFGLTYSAMALVGYFSFAFGHFSDRLGYKHSFAIGCFFYSIGLYLRAFPGNSLIAIASGIIAGFGASIALAALRLWMRSLASQESVEKMIGLKSSTNAIGTAIGCSAIGLITLSQSLSLLALLYLSAFGMFALALCTHFSPTPHKEVKLPIHSSHSPLFGIKKLVKNHLGLVIMTTILGALTGFYVSFISPYLPLIMKDKGMTLATIGLSTASFSLLRFIVDPLIARYISTRRKDHVIIFVASEVAVAAVTAAFLIPFSLAAFIGLLLLRSLFLGFSSITEESIWMKTFPQENIGLFFGLNQSAYFLGDFFGGFVNGYLYKSQGLDRCIQIVLVIMVINLTAFLLFFKAREANSTKEELACRAQA